MPTTLQLEPAPQPQSHPHPASAPGRGGHHEPDRLLRALLAAALLLAAVDAFAGLTYPGRALGGRAPLAWFRSSAECTIPTFFAVATMAAVGVCCLRRRAEPRRWWRVVGVLFCYLAADDLLMLHERIGALVHPVLGGHGVYAWVIALGPPFALLGVLGAVRLYGALAGDPRRRALLLGGFAALGIAVALEALEDHAGASAVRLRGIELLAYAQWCEESLELFGPVLLLGAVRAPRQRGAGGT